ncbi:MAG: transposase [Zoogloeaceae bacterium]|jgi:hypothetical protein|nr:transposase [Zoogloeaceae bacterium]
MNTTRHELLMQRWQVVQYELIPALRQEGWSLTPKLERVVHTLEWARVEELCSGRYAGTGRRPHERAWLANAFLAKSVLGIADTRALRERLTVDRSLQRICGFAVSRELPSESTFSRAFDEFSRTGLAARAHEALVKQTLGDKLIGHLSRDATAIEARERPQPRDKDQRKRPQRSIHRQRGQTLAEMLREIPAACDWGTKKNARGRATSWRGYKLHLDTADCGIPISALLSSASLHDSLAAIPLSLMSSARVTNLYDVMDAGYCSLELHEHGCQMGHVPLIDHNPRGGEKLKFEPPDAVRYCERTVAERMNARLKDEFGGRHVRVKGALKVMSHLMFGILALAVDQLMRLLC